MARIADKHGLTNRYREAGLGKRLVKRGRPRKYLFGAPSKRKRTHSRATPQYSYSEQNQQPTTKGCLAAVLVVIFVVIMIVIMATTSGNKSGNKDNTPVVTTEPTVQTEPPVDLAPFEGTPAIEASIDIEKEYDSWVLEVDTHVKNNTGKAIQELTLYLICCHDGATPSDSWKYADRLIVKDIKKNKTKDTAWTLGTTTDGEKEFICYIGYILYEDGTTWGTPTIDHKAVITRNERITVSFKEVEEFAWRD